MMITIIAYEDSRLSLSDGSGNVYLYLNYISLE